MSNVECEMNIGGKVPEFGSGELGGVGKAWHKYHHRTGHSLKTCAGGGRR